MAAPGTFPTVSQAQPKGSFTTKNHLFLQYTKSFQAKTEMIKKRLLHKTERMEPKKSEKPPWVNFQKQAEDFTLNRQPVPKPSQGVPLQSVTKATSHSKEKPTHGKNSRHAMKYVSLLNKRNNATREILKQHNRNSSRGCVAYTPALTEALRKRVEEYKRWYQEHAASIAKRKEELGIKSFQYTDDHKLPEEEKAVEQLPMSSKIKEQPPPKSVNLPTVQNIVYPGNNNQLHSGNQVPQVPKNQTVHAKATKENTMHNIALTPTVQNEKLPQISVKSWNFKEDPVATAVAKKYIDDNGLLDESKYQRIQEWIEHSELEMYDAIQEMLSLNPEEY